MLLEACVNSVASAIEAQKGGANRVELCENMADGGCTPSIGSIIQAKQHLSIPIFVMIRPRGADFCYSNDEFEVMKADIRAAKSVGANGVVLGILLPDGRVDQLRMQQLINLSRPMGITFHRAFDMTRDAMEAIDDLIRLGIDRVLTSGQAANALLGAPLIRQMVQHAGDKIGIMPGGGIKEYNVKEVIQATGAQEFHLYLTKEISSQMTFLREAVKMGKSDQSEFSYIQVDAHRIRKTLGFIQTRTR